MTSRAKLMLPWSQPPENLATTSKMEPSAASQVMKSGPVRPRVAGRSYWIGETRFSTPYAPTACDFDRLCPAGCQALMTSKRINRSRRV